jgi:hypothetical protein
MPEESRLDGQKGTRLDLLLLENSNDNEKKKKKKKKKKGRKRKRKNEKSIVLAFFNARHVINKEAVLKDLLRRQKAIYCGVSESRTYKQDSELSDSDWKWEGCIEFQPTAPHPPKQGVGTFTSTTRRFSLIYAGTYTVWHRLETDHGTPIIISSAYFPQATNIKGHQKANEELDARLTHYSAMGPIILGGDFNAHMGLNGDPMDTAGHLLQNTLCRHRLLLLNDLYPICSGGHTRSQPYRDLEQTSTVDYVACSQDLVTNIHSLVIWPDSLGSDHRPLFLTLNGLHPQSQPPITGVERWRTENIPSPPEDWSWILACQDQFTKWTDKSLDLLDLASALDTDEARVADILDWGFQHALEEAAIHHIGTRTSKPRKPLLDPAVKLSDHHRQMCEHFWRRTVYDENSTQEQRMHARSLFLRAARRARKTNLRRKRIADLKLFRDIEQHENNSKLFWTRVKKLRADVLSKKQPTLVARGKGGETVTEPKHVLRVWQNYWATIAAWDNDSPFNEKFRGHIESKLRALRARPLHQSKLDQPINQEEVFRAIRHLNMGKSPGEDGLIPDLIKSAADAVNNDKLRGDNSVDAHPAL